jgi:hypothetical protein
MWMTSGQSGLTSFVYFELWPNHTLQRSAAGHRGGNGFACNRSRRLGRWTRKG